tara:strand:- start:2993 stop:3196 length:204 start_codon:yes stop_codon:yes gene_type:complete
MTKLEKYPAFEKWLIRECKGDADALWFLLYNELTKENEIVFNWLDEKAGNLKTNLDKISKLIIKRNK